MVFFTSYLTVNPVETLFVFIASLLCFELSIVTANVCHFSEFTTHYFVISFCQKRQKFNSSTGFRIRFKLRLLYFQIGEVGKRELFLISSFSIFIYKQNVALFNVCWRNVCPLDSSCQIGTCFNDKAILNSTAFLQLYLLLLGLDSGKPQK